MEGDNLTYILVVIATVTYLLRWLKPPTSSLPHIPSLTPTAPLWSYYGCIRYLFSNKDLIQEGYEKYKGHAFKIPEPLRWSVVITGPKLIDELRKVPADVLDMHEAGKEVIQAEYTLDHRLLHNYYHVPLVRSTLTRSLAILLSDIRDEVSQAFSTLIPPSDDWVAVPALETVLQIVSRSTNRVIVGLPLARDPDFVKLNIDFAIDLFMGGQVIGMLPHFLRTLAVRWFTNVPSTIARATKHLEPIIQFRLKMMSTYGKDYDNKPNDFLSWLIDEAEGDELAVPLLVQRVLVVNMAAIHTTSQSFTFALYRLAANPEWILPMRGEVESVIKAEGWTKSAMQKMHHVDSFLKECQRCDGIVTINMTRVAMKDYTFSDGTFIPKGTFVSAAVTPMHNDEEYYADATVFNPWRFAELRDAEGESLKHQMASTNKEYLAFGHGKDACPGRFFATNSLKVMLAHLVLNYDIKFEEEGVLPKSLRIATMHTPNAKAKVLFRKR